MFKSSTYSFCLHYFFLSFRVLSVHAIVEPINTNATMPLSANSNDVNPCPTPNGIIVTSLQGLTIVACFLLLQKNWF